MANIVKGGTAHGAAGEGASTAAAGGADAGVEVQSPFGALLAQQVSQGALLGGKPLSLALNLLQSDAKPGAEKTDLTLDAQAEPGQLTVDPSALAGLVAQALAGYQAKAASTPASAEGGEKAAPSLKGIEASLADGGKQALVMADKATALPQPAAKAEVEAAGIAESGKMLPLEVAKKTTEVDVAPQDQFSDKLAAAQQTMAQPSSSAHAASTDGTARIQQPVGAPGWSGELGQKVVWMVGQQKQSAELQLNPPNLGPLEVRISLNQDQMSATFVSHHAAVREAIEAALPRLREMLADNGIALGNVSVGAESFAQQQQQQQAAFQGNGNGAAGQVPEFSLGGIDGDQAGRTTVARIEGNGLVNTFV
ncbi:MAG: flagellar hook-length control protein FliK [Sulfuricellaceae bacterium]